MPCPCTGPPGQEHLYFFGRQLGPRGAKATLVTLFLLGLLLLGLSLALLLRLRSERQRGAYREVQTCALPTEAL